MVAKPFASSFDVPVIWKFWVTVPPPGGETMAEAGDADVQLRFVASRSVAV